MDAVVHVAVDNKLRILGIGIKSGAHGYEKIGGGHEERGGMKRTRTPTSVGSEPIKGECEVNRS